MTNPESLHFATRQHPDLYATPVSVTPPAISAPFNGSQDCPTEYGNPDWVVPDNSLEQHSAMYPSMCSEDIRNNNQQPSMNREDQRFYHSAHGPGWYEMVTPKGEIVLVPVQFEHRESTTNVLV